jgi:hypothetical protein
MCIVFAPDFHLWRKIPVSLGARLDCRIAISSSFCNPLLQCKVRVFFDPSLLGPSPSPQQPLSGKQQYVWAVAGGVRVSCVRSCPQDVLLGCLLGRMSDLNRAGKLHSQQQYQWVVSSFRIANVTLM